MILIKEKNIKIIYVKIAATNLSLPQLELSTEVNKLLIIRF